MYQTDDAFTIIKEVASDDCYCNRHTWLGCRTAAENGRNAVGRAGKRWLDRFRSGENAETLIEKYNAQLAKLDTS
jgi:hypothetical protein